MVQGYLSPELFASNFFDVITMWHVLEHIPDPNNVLQTASYWLKDEGIIFIATQNIDSNQARFGKDLWFNLDPPRHVHHFSSKTLERILRKNGFKVEYISYFYPELNCFSQIQTFLNKIGCTPNFIFNFFKKNKRGLPDSPFLLFKDAIMTVLFLVIFGFSFLCLSMIEELFGKGGSLVIVARKIKR